MSDLKRISEIASKYDNSKRLLLIKHFVELESKYDSLEKSNCKMGAEITSKDMKIKNLESITEEAVFLIYDLFHRAEMHTQTKDTFWIYKVELRMRMQKLLEKLEMQATKNEYLEDDCNSMIRVIVKNAGNLEREEVSKKIVSTCKKHGFKEVINNLKSRTRNDFLLSLIDLIEKFEDRVTARNIMEEKCR